MHISVHVSWSGEPIIVCVTFIERKQCEVGPSVQYNGWPVEWFRVVGIRHINSSTLKGVSKVFNAVCLLFASLNL